VILLKTDSLGIYSDGSSVFVSKCKYQSETVLKVSFRVALKGQIKKAWVRICPDGERQHLLMKKKNQPPF